MSKEKHKPEGLTGDVTVKIDADLLLTALDSVDKKGYLMGIPPLDKIYSVETSMLQLITGKQSSGKSELALQQAVYLAKTHGFKAAIVSPETSSEKIALKLLRKYLGYKPTKAQLKKDMKVKQAIDFVAEHFIVFARECTILEDVIDTFTERYKADQSLKMLVIDPYNTVVLRRYISSTVERSDIYLGKLRELAVEKELLVSLIAHPTKPRKTGYGNFKTIALDDVNGSVLFGQRCDLALVLNRSENGRTKITVGKVKDAYLGQLGASATAGFDPASELFIAPEKKPSDNPPSPEQDKEKIHY